MANLQVPCFRYLDQDLTAPLVVEPGAGADVLVECPIRGRPYRLTPEERVRQAWIWFLREGCNRASVLGRYLRVGVEESSLDVACFSAGDVLDEQFCPSVTVAITETKRQEEELADHVEQLKTYMLRERCRAGLLFNGRQALWLSLAGDFTQPEWSAHALSDLREAEERIERASLEANAHLARCRQAFSTAAGGDFDALARLVSLFGSDRSLTFVLSVRARGSIGSVQAFGLRVDNPNLITYRARGVITRTRPQLFRQDFHSLLALRPL